MKNRLPRTSLPKVEQAPGWTVRRVRALKPDAKLMDMMAQSACLQGRCEGLYHHVRETFAALDKAREELTLLEERIQRRQAALLRVRTRQRARD